ncbi:hypothetical protein P7K49_024512 [Saguinus oedipus]|uniref:Uncharacterized protein n=1 Tax=Saguinus oedipus TaxID=9490 RepID=A0ABQ9UPR0_SAGOE|nr:hypothetical protein P7K49_024512 [Saguinus oedipus]
MEVSVTEIKYSKYITFLICSWIVPWEGLSLDLLFYQIFQGFPKIVSRPVLISDCSFLTLWRETFMLS